MRRIIIALWFLIGSHAAIADDRREPDAREVLHEISGYYADMVCIEGRMAPAFESHFWQGATITTVWQAPGLEKADIVPMSVSQFVAQSPKGACREPVFQEKMKGAKVRLRKGLAQVWAHYSARFGKPGSVKTWSGIDAFTLLKHENRWKIASLVFRPD